MTILSASKCPLIAALAVVHLGWLADRFWGLFGGLFIVAYGLLGFLRPDVVLRWVAAAHPRSDLEQHNPAAQRFVRGLSIILGTMGLFVFAATALASR